MLAHQYHELFIEIFLYGILKSSATTLFCGRQKTFSVVSLKIFLDYIILWMSKIFIAFICFHHMFCSIMCANKRI